MNKFKMLLVATVLLMATASFAQDNKQPQTKQAEKVSYACPMHADVKSDKPGKCSKCGMDLKEVKTAKTSFVCPMHADVKSDKAGKCSKCGMDLKEVKATAKN
jgi:transcription initiation factor IIE alpha subunit